MKVENEYRGKGFVWIELKSCVVVSSYFSPNRNDEEFETLLADLDTHLRSQKKGVIIGADWNAKTEMIGSKTSNSKEKILQDWVASRDLIVINQGNVPTFVGARGTSIINVTLATESIGRNVQNWAVNENKENMSDHNSINFQVVGKWTEESERLEENRGWRITPASLCKLQNGLKHFVEAEIELTPEALIENVVGYVTNACSQYLPSRKTHGGKNPAYWWTQEISTKRKKCHKIRRKLTRLRKTERQQNTEDEARRELKEAKHALKKEIWKSKREKWKILCDDLEEDVWGKAYKIAFKKLKIKHKIPTQAVDEQVIKHFPQKEHIRWPAICVNPYEIPKIDQEELKTATALLKNKKAPGTDNITAEVVKVFVNILPNTIVQIFNDCLTHGVFPEVWKTGKLVLLEKPMKEG